MSGIHTPKHEIQKRLEFYRRFKAHGFANELSALAFNALAADIQDTQQKCPQLTKPLRIMLTTAKAAKLANNLRALEGLRSDLTLLRNKHHID